MGGLQTVTLGDTAAAATNGGSKTRTERRGASSFGVVAEVIRGRKVRLHLDAERSIDAMLAPSGSPQQQLTQLRVLGRDSQQPGGRQVVKVRFDSATAAAEALRKAASGDSGSSNAWPGSALRSGGEGCSDLEGAWLIRRMLEAMMQGMAAAAAAEATHSAQPQR